jgi:AraC-like DNA-binding protein
MKIAKLRLQQEIEHSFIIHNEVSPFAPWHHHPEYELVLILKGKGKRMVGDNVDRFEENDLIFTGPFLPHQWLCDAYPPDHQHNCQESAFIIQFVYDFLGEKFFDIPENVTLKKFLTESVRGCKFYGKAKEQIISILLKMINNDGKERLYGLLSIFEVLASCHEYCFLSSPDSIESFSLKENETMQKTLQYILQNFHKKIQIKDLIEITSMSYASFYSHFRRIYKMPFKGYLLETRIEFACKLLANETQNISEIAYHCGFENISNFNRQFKRIKNVTPSQFQKQLESHKILYNLSLPVNS